MGSQLPKQVIQLKQSCKGGYNFFIPSYLCHFLPWYLIVILWEHRTEIHWFAYHANSVHALIKIGTATAQELGTEDDITMRWESTNERAPWSPSRDWRRQCNRNKIKQGGRQQCHPLPMSTKCSGDNTWPGGVTSLSTKVARLTLSIWNICKPAFPVLRYNCRLGAGGKEEAKTGSKNSFVGFFHRGENIISRSNKMARPKKEGERLSFLLGKRPWLKLTLWVGVDREVSQIDPTWEHLSIVDYLQNQHTSSRYHRTRRALAGTELLNQLYL